MELRQLRYFVEIAAAGSLREASARLRVAQPALTRHLRLLEEELGTDLCVRHARGIRLTSAGTRFLEEANLVVRNVEQIRTRISEEVESPSGIATIGASSAMGRLLFGGVAEKISRDYPRIALRMVEGGAYTLLAALDARRIDIAVMVDPDARSGFAMEALVTEPVYLIGGSTGDRPSENVIDISQLESYPLVTFGRPSGPQKIFNRAAAEAGVRLNIAYELESLEVVKDFVDRGLGFALLPHSSIIEELGEDRFPTARLEGVGITRTLVMREELLDSPVVELVAGIVRDEFEVLSREGVFGSPSS